VPGGKHNVLDNFLGPTIAPYPTRSAGAVVSYKWRSFSENEKPSKATPDDI